MKLFGGSSFAIVENDSARIFMHDTEYFSIKVRILGNVLVKRKKALRGNLYRETIVVANPTKSKVQYEANLYVKPKFRDIFEVRGIHPSIDRIPEASRGTFKYRGIDGIVREFSISIRKGKGELSPYSWEKIVVEGEIKNIFNHIPHSPRIFAKGLWGLLEKALQDIRALSVLINSNPILFAGIPDFFCVFGRDSIISSLFLLPYTPEYAKGTLKVLASLQGKNFNSHTLEEPGKIPHEYRVGELSLSGKLPFSPYYGSIDATPLFLILAEEYLKWTNDEETIKGIGKNIEMAFEWVLGKLREGYIYYEYSNPFRPMNQGWKDSANGIPDENGIPVKPPIALVEVQGYAYAALVNSYIFEDIVDVDTKKLINEGKKLKKRFNKDFIARKKKFYKLAKNSSVLASNQGHLLVSGIADYPNIIVDSLFSENIMTRWGIRTLAEYENAYDPFSYHNGSIWPHDNAIIALGLQKSGFHEEAEELSLRVLSALRELNSIPELYAGLDSELPFEIKRANNPQAWSATSIFAFITASLGISPNEIEEEKTLLPDFKVYPVYIGGKKIKVEVKNGEIFTSRIP
ncbi:glycogen debranching N-terminal domain-containing protein [Pyrococcus sp. ST04]|uniref:glycogen debranching N-terminal domain-containing protein n=1 Tax=Pyrococcus sp. ST04 TaxID=1183377 RepID=UPI0002605B79|nr:glycogen debranching N-terminal domain-containing protein [Pyrococcus sp. ST04]AFK22861.1 Glycogen debranching enzyme [Pyrococcus sp. ST04]